ncbi:MAG: diguanylate cyclase [Salinarimonas sp.]|nr:diguanylate cyclase [Salinarimonas sp.]
MARSNQSVQFDLIAMFDEIPNCVAVFNEEDRIVYANESFRNAYFVEGTGQSWSEMMRENFRHQRGPIIETDDIDAWLKSAESRRGTDPYRSFEIELHGGVWLWITETMFADGAMLLIGSDISKLKPGTRSLRLQRDSALRASFTDELTDVPNRRYIMLQLEEWRKAGEARKNRSEACLAVIDIDHFKPINDEYGHEIGDRILVHFCELFLDNIRLNDLFGRIGGEEFVLFMPHCNVDQARARLSEVAAKVRSARPVAEYPDLHYTFSAGLVAVSQDDGVEASLRRADDLLYDAKDAGRDHIAS